MSDFIFVKQPDSVLYLTAYEVFHADKSIGFVKKRRGFSYRGTGGWNRGIRLRDYHPIEWVYGKELHSANSWCSNRQRGAENLLREQNND